MVRHLAEGLGGWPARGRGTSAPSAPVHQCTKTVLSGDLLSGGSATLPLMEAVMAWSEGGDPVEVPDEAVAWRVKRFAGSKGGRPSLCYSADGLPLRVPLSTTPPELADLVVGGEAAKYRLDFVDATGAAVAGAVPCYITLSDALAATKPGAVDARDKIIFDQGRLIRELVDSVQQTHQQIASQFAGVVASTAQLVRAADGAGLPAREAPLATLEVVEPAGEAPPWATAIEQLATQGMPLLRHMVHTKALGLTVEQSAALLGTTAPTLTPAVATATATATVVVDVESRIAEVLGCLTATEQATAHELLKTMPTERRDQVCQHLAELPTVAQAVQAVRQYL